ncbi:stearoyl-CoA 9-desaturase [Blastocladiella emersonii ATCC 22665]|nr:stearoyl-CoA 9-desaturase [Blastocladiella emersonii ATCC 22665]
MEPETTLHQRRVAAAFADPGTNAAHAPSPSAAPPAAIPEPVARDVVDDDYDAREARLAAEQKAWEESSLWPRLKWDQVLSLLLEPFVAVWAATQVPLTRATAAFAVAYYVITATGITAGYHRLWSHRAYAAAWPYRLWMALAGAGSIQGSIKWWARRHRVHHRYTDTDKDPYSAHRGLLWSHFLWLMVKPGPATHHAQSRVDMRDLNADPIVVWQHKLFVPLSLFMSFGVPTLVAHYGWGDALGGLVWAGLVRMVLLHHATFCVNSLAHYLGEATYDDTRSPRDHLLTALITMGEGMHNLHHEWPKVVENGYRWYDWDPTKWLIFACSYVGLTYDLITAPHNEVRKGALHMKLKKLEQERASLVWGPEPATLPAWTELEFREELRLNPAMVIIDGLAHDVSRFIHDHPGGVAYLKAYLGKDASRAFNKTVYVHSNAARNWLSRLRVARIVSSSSKSEIATEE